MNEHRRFIDDLNFKLLLDIHKNFLSLNIIIFFKSIRSYN